MASNSYLQRHGAGWRFRYRIPRERTYILGRKTLVVRLHARTHAQAARCARALRVDVERVMSDLTPGLTMDEARSIVGRWVSQTVRAIEDSIIENEGLMVLSRDEIDRLDEHDPESRSGTGLELLCQTAMAMPGTEPRLPWFSPDDAPKTTHVSALINDCLERIRGERNLAPADERRLAYVARHGAAAVMEAIAKLAAGEPISLGPASSQAAVQPVEPPTPSADETGLFIAAWDRFKAEKRSTGQWTAETAVDTAGTRKIFEALCPGLTIGKMDRKAASSFREALFKLPRDYARALPWRNMEPSEVLRKISSEAFLKKHNKNSDDLPRLSVKTVEKHFTYLAGYYEYLQKIGTIPDDRKNPFSGFHVSSKMRGDERHKRHAWSDEQMRRLLLSPLYQGARSARHLSKPGQMIVRDGRFWAVLLAAHTGMRAEEICSRKVADIYFDNGIAMIKIEHGKTRGSVRNVPIPKVVLQAGFLEYRYYMRDSHELLFPEFPPDARTGKHADPLSKWFARYRRDIGVPDEKVDLHSLRATFITNLENKSTIKTTFVEEVVGHISKERESERRRYTKTILAENLKTVVDAIDYGVDLTAISYAGIRGERASDAERIIAVAVKRNKDATNWRKPGAKLIRKRMLRPPKV